jgi:hypothetical protein
VELHEKARDLLPLELLYEVSDVEEVFIDAIF